LVHCQLGVSRSGIVNELWISNHAKS
jgi:protein-tyrosine phosphatase